MRRSAPLIAAAVLAATLAASAPSVLAQARAAATQTSSNALGASNLPIDISSDNAEQFREERRAVWWGNVEAIQGTSRLRTPRLTVYYAARDPHAPKPAANDPGADVGQIERIECEGPVFYITPTQHARGDHATYLAADDTITMTGHVVTSQDKNVAVGDKLVIHQKTGVSTFTTASGKSPNGQRVRAVLYPKNDQTAPAPAAPAAPARPPQAKAPAHP